MKIDRIIEEVELSIEFHYVPYNPGDYNNPPERGYVTVENIYHKEESIFEIIDFDIISKIEEELYEELNDL